MLDSRRAAAAFEARHLELVGRLADQAGIALGNARLVDELRRQADEIRRLNEQLAKEVEEQRIEILEKQSSLEVRFRYDSLVGASPAMQRVYRILDKIVPTQIPVLVTGESGTGKDLVARVVHYNGPRRERRVRDGQLRRADRDAAGVRAVRPPARRVHRRRPRPQGAVRAGRRRDAVPRRDRRDADAPPAEAAARDPVRRDPPAGRGPAAAGRRADRGRDQPRARGGRARGALPRGPALPARRRARPPRAAARADRRRRPARRRAARGARPAAPARRRSGSSRRRCGCSCATTGRGTCASWSTS